MRVADKLHEYTLNVVKQIEKSGIKVKLTPFPEKHKQDKSLNKYKNNLQRASIDRWVRVSFFVNKEQAKLIGEKCTELAKKGIQFDTGGTICEDKRIQLDWELDWSFKCNNVSNETDQLMVIAKKNND